MTIPRDATLDASALRSLLEMVDGDAGFVGELVDTYLEDSPRQLAQMRAAIERGSADDLVRPAHTLKGNSTNLGATQLATICRELETRGRERRLDGAPESVVAAEEEYARVVEALRDARARGWTL